MNITCVGIPYTMPYIWHQLVVCLYYVSLYNNIYKHTTHHLINRITIIK